MSARCWLCTVIAFAMSPTAAQAAVHSTTIYVTPPSVPAVLGQPPPTQRAVYPEAFRYDDVLGTIAVGEQGLYPGGDVNGTPVMTWPGFGSISFGFCRGGELQEDVIDLDTNDDPILATGDLFDPTDSNGIAIFNATESGLDGELQDTSVVSPTSLTLYWSDSVNFVDLDLNCVRVAGDDFYFDGAGPPTIRARAATKVQVELMTAAANKHHSDGFDRRVATLAHVKVTSNHWAFGTVKARNPKYQGNGGIVFHYVTGRWRVVTWGSSLEGSSQVPATVVKALGI